MPRSPFAEKQKKGKFTVFGKVVSYMRLYIDTG